MFFFRFMPKEITYCILLIFGMSVYTSAQTVHHKKTVFQAFWWDYKNNNYPDGWANYLTDLAPRLRQMGVDAVWVPPSIKNQSFIEKGVGYAPYDHYDLGDKFQKGDVKTRLGTKDELLRMVAVMNANGIEVIQDIVPNHTIGAGSDNGSGGQDPAAPAVPCTDDWKNFRYTSWETPAGNQTPTDYLSRKGRWPKNHHNFHPNNAHNCNLCSADADAWCWQGFGPDVCYYDGAYGPSSNAVYNPDQQTYSPYNNGGIGTNNGYMRKHTREWLIWSKKQIGYSGLRIDAVKHFPEAACLDFLVNLQSNAQWANGGNYMFSVGEWVGGTGTLDAWTNAMQGRSGTFDFNLRAFDGSGGLRSMITSDGDYNLSQLPVAQQNYRYLDIGNERIHRTVPFVNNHDTYRPQTNASGNITGWNSDDELSPHIDPLEPRLAAAYAIIHAMDGNPQPFFEDVFNVANTSKRWTHLPTNTTDLPVNTDLANIIKAHGALDFKSGVYKVRSNEASFDNNNPPHNNNNFDHLIIERSGKAIIGVTDVWGSYQSAWIDTDFPVGTWLRDYSGGHGDSLVQVQCPQAGCNQPGSNRVNIKTRAVGYPSFTYSTSYANTGAHYHGYSIWAPVGIDFEGYARPSIPTTQEWEMADDLGDSNCFSLGQGGMLPKDSYDYRIVGKIFAEGSSTVSYEMFFSPVVGDVSNCVSFYNLQGTKLHCNCDTGNFSGNFSVPATGWVVAKIRHNPGNGCNNVFLCGEQANGSAPAQKAFVKLSYNAPSSISTSDYPADLPAPSPFWTGAAGDQDYNNPKNWEKCVIPPLSSGGKNVIYVRQSASGSRNGTSWENALTSLEEAFDAASFCNNVDEIWVTQGSYLPNTSGNIAKPFVLPPGMKIYGGFPSTGSPVFSQRDPSLYPTIMSADIGNANDPSDNTYHVAVLNPTSLQTVLDGFTLLHGNANGAEEDGKGGGIINKGSLELRNITITSCTAGTSAAALFNTGFQAVIKISDCIMNADNVNPESTVVNEAGASMEVENVTRISKQ
jgi:alpha-amylase